MSGFTKTVGGAVEETLADLTDVQWTAIEPLLPAALPRGRRRSADLRQVVSAINYHWRTGRSWRKLPAQFPCWPTVYGYFGRWRKDGTLTKLRSVLDPPRRSEVTRSRRPARRMPTRFDPDRDLMADAVASRSAPR